MPIGNQDNDNGSVDQEPVDEGSKASTGQKTIDELKAKLDQEETGQGSKSSTDQEALVEQYTEVLARQFGQAFKGTDTWKPTNQKQKDQLKKLVNSVLRWRQYQIKQDKDLIKAFKGDWTGVTICAMLDYVASKLGYFTNPIALGNILSPTAIEYKRYWINKNDSFWCDFEDHHFSDIEKYMQRIKEDC